MKTERNFADTSNAPAGSDKPTTVDANSKVMRDETEELSSWNQFVWWLLGVCNNFIWVIAAASASEISAAAYGLTYLANSAPCVIICLIAPYTFHLVPYEFRMGIAGITGILSMILIALPLLLGSPPDLAMAIQLTGVALVAIQCQLGECTLLAYASAFGGKKSRRYLSFYASGTGMAGVLGTVYPLIFETILGFSLSTMVLVGLVVPVLYIILFFFLVEPIPSCHVGADSDTDSVDSVSGKAKALEEGTVPAITKQRAGSSVFCSSWKMENTRDQGWSLKKRFTSVLSLWIYIIPLFTVYFGEYFIQSGLWGGIGIPDPYTQEGRSEFYHYAVIAYQVAVFISRSSGLVIVPNLTLIWCLPVVQLGMVGLFAAVALTQFWTGFTLLIPSFVVGLLGGASYALTYVHISLNYPEEEREFSVATVTVAENFGLTLSSLTSIPAQAAVWRKLGIVG